MPVILSERIPAGEIVLWETDGDYESLASQAHPEDNKSALRFTNILRRTEHLSARAALRISVPDAVVGYDSAGGPYLENSGLHIGLSHCNGAAAAIVCNMPCAIDIEDSGRDFTRAAARFISPAERDMTGSDHPLHLPAVWCAKEALYKYARIPGLDLIKDLEILSVDLSGTEAGRHGTMAARIGQDQELEVTVRSVGRFIFCYTVK